MFLIIPFFLDCLLLDLSPRNISLNDPIVDPNTHHDIKAWNNIQVGKHHPDNRSLQLRPKYL